MKRILVLGSPGSGKSTLSKSLGKLLRLPVVHLDVHYWRPGWVAAPKEEWKRMVTELVSEERWIMDGNYSGTMDIRLREADTVIFMDMPVWLCTFRVIKRRWMYHNKTRPDLNEGCPEKLDFEFIKWVWQYPRRTRLETLDKLEQLRHDKLIYIVKNRKQTKQLLETLKNDTYRG